MKDEKYCYQHKNKFSSKIIIHDKPALKYNAISFLEKKKIVGKCQFKNKYGEHACNCEHDIKNFCKLHASELLKFSGTVKKLLNLLTFYKLERYTLDSFMKLYLNLYKYMIKHKEKFVIFSMHNFVDIIIEKNNQIISDIFSRKTYSLIIHKKSTLIIQHINKLFKLKSELRSILIPAQIEQAKKELINTNINIHMLSEIYIKKSENSNEKFPVFCKGIDKHILSFVIGN